MSYNGCRGTGVTRRGSGPSQPPEALQGRQGVADCGDGLFGPSQRFARMAGFGEATMTSAA